MKDELIDLVVGAVGRLIGTLISSLAGIGFVKKLCDLMLGIAKLCKDLGEMVQAFAESLIDLAQGGSGVIGRIAERMQGVLTKAIRPLMTILLAGIGLQGLVTKVKGLFSKIAEAIGKVVMKAWKALFTLIKKIFGGKDGDGGGGTCKIGKSSPVGQSGALGPNASADSDCPAPRLSVETGTEKPPNVGGKPNSVHVRTTRDGRAVQSTIYNEKGEAIGHIDWKDREGHKFGVPGQPGTGHGPGFDHIPLGDLPADWKQLPTGVTPVPPRHGS